MLKQEDLQSQLEKAFRNILPGAIEACKLEELPSKSAVGDANAKRFADTFTDMVAGPLATAISSAVDYYIKNASITGTLITYGSPTTHTATISSMPQPAVNGKVPNTLGIS
jgi:hypothetical protein